MTLEQLLANLRERRASAVAAMREIIEAAIADDEREGDDLTPEETTKYDGLLAEVGGFDSQISRVEAQIEIEERLEATVPAAARGVVPPVHAPGDPARTSFESIGEFLHAVTYNRNDQRLASLWQDPSPSAEQSAGVGSAGGFAIPQQFRNDMLRVTPQSAAFRPRAQVIPAGSPPDAAVTITALDQDTAAAPANVYGGVSVTWIAEGAGKPETDVKIREIKLEPQEVAGHIVATDRMLRNWPAFTPLLESQLRGAVISSEEHAFLSGNGVGKPLGLLNAGASALVNRVIASEFHYDDVAAMQAKLMMGGSPVWLISQSAMPQLLKMRNEIGSPPVGDGSLIWQPNARDTAGMQLLMGYPIIWHERSPLIGVKGDIILADLSKYLIKDGSGPFVASSEHVKFLENKTVIKVFWNVDGQPWLTAPFKQEGGYTVSPFVVLDVPSA